MILHDDRCETVIVRVRRACRGSLTIITFDLVLGVVHQALADQRVHAGHVRGRVFVRVEPAGAREHHASAELVAARQRHQVPVDPNQTRAWFSECTSCYRWTQCYEGGRRGRRYAVIFILRARCFSAAREARQIRPRKSSSSTPEFFGGKISNNTPNRQLPPSEVHAEFSIYRHPLCRVPTENDLTRSFFRLRGIYRYFENMNIKTCTVKELLNLNAIMYSTRPSHLQAFEDIVSRVIDLF